jgi:hypothetical protein
MKSFLLIAFLFTATSVWASDSIEAFATDYCTNYREGTREKPEQWKHCCLVRDMLF